MAEKKIRIAYVGDALDNGAMDVNDLAPALLAFAELVKRASEVVGSTQNIRVTLKADSIRKGSFDISLWLDYNILDQVKALSLFLDESGLSAIADVISAGEIVKGGVVTLGGGLFWLIKKIGKRGLKKSVKDNDNNIEIILQDGTPITVTQNTYNLYIDHKARECAEKVVAPLKQSGIDCFEFRNPDNYEDKKGYINIAKHEVNLFDAPGLAQPEINVTEQIMFLKIVGIVFDADKKWRFSDGDTDFWARIEDESFWKQIDAGEIAFRKGDKLKAKVRIVQTFKEGDKLVIERTIMQVIGLIPKPTQIKLEFEEQE